jgi:RimJ/RimL family protein N-acetyltransferase
MRAVEEADLDGLLGVYLSSPEVLAVTEGSAGEPGRYDRGMLERDVWMSQLDPLRHTHGLFLRGTGACVGVIDWIDEHPDDRCPWIGLVMVHAAHRRRGYAREAVSALAGHGRTAGWGRLRAAAIEGDAAATGLLRAAGMHEVDRRTGRFAAGERSLVVMELAL